MIFPKQTAANGRRFLLVIAIQTGALLMGLIPGQATAQEGIGWEAHYDFHLNLGLSRKFKARLLISDRRSMFYWGNPIAMAEEPTATDFHLTVGRQDSIGSSTYTDRATRQMISVLPPISGRNITVCEALPEIPWKITGNQKTIGPYKCQEARGSFRGRTYSVWFTPDLPVPFGPWKLQGLPGLIVYARDDSWEVAFSLDYLRSNTTPIAPLYPEDNCMDIETYAYFQEEWARDLIRRMNAKLPRGSRMELGQQNTMERFDH